MAEGGFDFPLTGGQGELILEQIKSRNFVSGVSGWILRRDGTAEFASLTLHFDGQFGRMELVDGEIRWFDLQPLLRMLATVDGTNNNPSIILYSDTGDPILLIDAQDSNGQPSVKVVNPASAAFARFAIIPAQSSAGFELRPPNPAPTNSWENGQVTVQQYLVSGFSKGALWLVSPSEVGRSPATIQIEGATVGNNVRRVNIDADEVNFDGSDIRGIRSTLLTPVQGFDSANVASIVVAYTAIGGGASDVTIPPPPSGKIRVDISAAVNNSLGAPAGTEVSLMSFEVRETNAAGLLLRAAQDVDMIVRSSNLQRWGTSTLITGMPTNVNLFVRLMYRVSVAASGTGNFSIRRLIVTPEL